MLGAEFSTEGGEIKFYSDNKGNLKKIMVVLGYETGRLDEEYYINNYRLIFVFKNNVEYNSPIYFTQKERPYGAEAFDYNKGRHQEDRYYFNGSKMIRWVNHLNKQVRPDSSEFKAAESELLDSFQKYKEMRMRRISK